MIGGRKAPVQIHVRCDQRRCPYVGKMMVPSNFYAVVNKPFEVCPECRQHSLCQYEAPRV